MASLVGKDFPEDVAFQHVPYVEEKAGVHEVCGFPVKYDISKEVKNKKIVIVAVPGAFTPTCSEQHVPTFLQKRDALKAKGVDQIVIIAYNDAFVMSAWGKANGVKDDFIIFASDPEAKFSKSIGWTMGERTGRYAIIVDNGKVTYAEEAEKGGIAGSDADAILSKL